METIRNNKAAETILEFNKIKEIWKGYAMTDGAKEAIEGAAPMLSESQVLARLRETTEARDMIQRSGQPPLVSLSGIREWMRLAEIGGTRPSGAFRPSGSRSMTSWRRWTG